MTMMPVVAQLLLDAMHIVSSWSIKKNKNIHLYQENML